MSNTHTPGKWKVGQKSGPEGYALFNDDNFVCYCKNEDDAHRIVMCMNALHGLIDDEIRLLYDFIIQRNQLAEVLESYMKSFEERGITIHQAINIKNKVVEVRLLQKEYFKDRDRDVLIRSKKAEADLDKLIF